MNDSFTDFQDKLRADPGTMLVVNLNTDRETVTAARQSGLYVYIGRTSPWGNPFQVGWDGDLEEVVDKYRDWIQSQPDLMAKLPALRGKILGCYCAPRSCHGDVLVELASQSSQENVYSPSSGDANESIR